MSVYKYTQTKIHFDYCPIERKMIVVTVFIWVLNQTEFNLFDTQKESCRYDHIPFYSTVTRNVLNAWKHSRTSFFKDVLIYPSRNTPGNLSIY